MKQQLGVALPSKITVESLNEKLFSTGVDALKKFFKANPSG